MDFGLLGCKGFDNQDSNRASSDKLSHEIKRKGVIGSEPGSKMAKIMPLQLGTPLLRSTEGSFSSLKNGAFGFPYQCPRNGGYGSVSLNANMHQSFVRGAFTPSQWIELEHQALIYKYLTANVPVPSNLLIPLRKSINSFGLSSSFSGSYHPNSLGWSSFHLGYSGNTDPEPGRCRRTDGKKWRCSRDAVADQKYCERHINRGRHRSRKPVEGQTGQAYLGTTNSRVVPSTSSISTSLISTATASSNSLVIPQNQFKSMQTGAAINPSPAQVLVNRIQDTKSFTMRSSSTNLKSSEPPFTVPKQDYLFGGSSYSEFGLVSSDSLLNPSQKMSYINPKHCESFLGFNDPETQVHNQLRHFIDNWPKDQSNRSVITWPEELKSDWTQLSMSIPMASSDFPSSSSSPTQDKLTHSPLKLSHEFDAIQMGSRMNSNHSASSPKKTNWLPIPWGASLGGPLGEVLTSTGSADISQHFGSSPTGVLQKATFGSLLNSSLGSSPKPDNKNHDGVISFPNNVPSATVV